MDGEVEQPWQIVVGRDTAQQPTLPEVAYRVEHTDLQRGLNVDQSLADTLFEQLLEPFEIGSDKLHAATNVVSAAEQDGYLPWMVTECLSTKHPKDLDAADTATPETTAPPSGKTTASDINSGNRKRPVSVLDRPRLRAPRGDPTKKHKCPVQGCNYSANGTGHLYRHMLTHNGRKDHQVSPHVATSAGILAANRRSSAVVASSARGLVANTLATKQHIFGHTRGNTAASGRIVVQ